MYRFCALLAALLPAIATAQHGMVVYHHVQRADSSQLEEVSSIEGELEFMGLLPKAPGSWPHILTFDAKASLMQEDAVFGDSMRAALNLTTMTQMLRDGIGPERIWEISKAILQVANIDHQSIAELPPNATYVNFESKTYTQQRLVPNLFLVESGLGYLVSGEMEALAWHVEEEVRTILGFRVIRATAVQDSVSLEAWFAPDIPMPAGPLLYGGLPGLILEPTLGDGEQAFTATEVDLESIPEVTPPTIGLAVTAEEFERLVADLTAAMRQALEESF